MAWSGSAPDAGRRRGIRQPVLPCAGSKCYRACHPRQPVRHANRPRDDARGRRPRARLVPRAARRACRYVVTPNVDHAVLFQHRADLRAAYADASLVLADGAPIVLASRLLQPLAAGARRRQRPGAATVRPHTQAPLQVFLLGAAPGVAETAAARIERRWRNVQVVGTYSPPLGFENDVAENARILAAIAAAGPIWSSSASAPRSRSCGSIAIATSCRPRWSSVPARRSTSSPATAAARPLDAPAGLEWLHRVCSEPRRLAARYARDAWVFPQLVWREWRRANG